MTREELTQENVGKPVLVYLDRNFNEARATLRSWSRDKKKAFVTLSSFYGKKWNIGQTVELPIDSVRVVKQ